MAADNVNAQTKDSAKPQENESLEVLEALMERRRLPFLWPIESREDGAHNVMVRLLTAAKERGLNLAALLANEPKIIDRAVAAERCAVRRRWKSLPLSMSNELAEAIPDGLALDEVQTNDVIDTLVREVRLSPEQAEFVRHYYGSGIRDFSALVELTGIDRAELYRIHYDVKEKLRAIPSIVKRLLENHAQLE